MRSYSNSAQKDFNLRGRVLGVRNAFGVLRKRVAFPLSSLTSVHTTATHDLFAPLLSYLAAELSTSTPSLRPPKRSRADSASPYTSLFATRLSGRLCVALLLNISQETVTRPRILYDFCSICCSICLGLLETEMYVPVCAVLKTNELMFAFYKMDMQL